MKPKVDKSQIAKPMTNFVMKTVIQQSSNFEEISPQNVIKISGLVEDKKSEINGDTKKKEFLEKSTKIDKSIVKKKIRPFSRKSKNTISEIFNEFHKKAEKIQKLKSKASQPVNQLLISSYYHLKTSILSKQKLTKESQLGTTKPKLLHFLKPILKI